MHAYIYILRACQQFSQFPTAASSKIQQEAQRGERKKAGSHMWVSFWKAPELELMVKVGISPVNALFDRSLYHIWS